MICKNCGRESDGNYCSHCGQPLNIKGEQEEQKVKEEATADEEQPKSPRKEREQKSGKTYSKNNTQKSGKTYPKNNTQKNSKAYPKRKRKKRRAKRRKKSLPSATSLMPMKTIKKTVSSVLQAVSAVLMTVIGFVLGKALIEERNTLGVLNMMIQEKNYAMALFYGIMISMIGFALLSIAWILSKKKLMSEDRIKSFDSGRGAIPFACYAVIVLLAPELLKILPEAHEALKGIQLAMEVLKAQQKIIGTCAVFGIVACLARKLIRVS